MSDGRSVQFQLSPLLLGSLIAGIASSIAVVVFGVMTQRPPLGPGMVNPPPPPGMPGLVISVGICVVAWVAVFVALARDQVLRRMADLKATLAATEEYGERRETDGYLRAMRTAGLVAPGSSASPGSSGSRGSSGSQGSIASPGPAGAGEVRALHRVPPSPPNSD